MLAHNYSYEATLADSLKIGWQVNDLIGPGKGLDFSRPFLPESLAGVRGLSSLSAREQLLLNQIRAHSYLYLFGVLEEYVVLFVLDEARAEPGCDLYAVRALATFAEEEAKHIHLFRRFAEEFTAGFGSPCGVVGPAADVIKLVLSHSALGVLLLTLHLEWMTQAHYVDSIKDDQDLDPQFKSMLRHHWMEEAQHVKLDTLLIDRVARAGGPEAIAKGLADYAALGAAMDGLFQQQVQLDLASLEAASGRALGDDERQEIAAAQLRSYRATFLVSGFVHKNVLSIVEQLSPGAGAGLLEMARALS